MADRELRRVARAVPHARAVLLLPALENTTREPARRDRPDLPRPGRPGRRPAGVDGDGQVPGRAAAPGRQVLYRPDTESSIIKRPAETSPAAVIPGGDDPDERVVLRLRLAVHAAAAARAPPEGMPFRLLVLLTDAAIDRVEPAGALRLDELLRRRRPLPGHAATWAIRSPGRSRAGGDRDPRHDRRRSTAPPPGR